VIFSRRRGGSGRHARPDETRPTGPRHAAGDQGADELGPDGPDEFEDDPVPDPGPGPYDVSEAPEGVARLDLGSLQIPATDGVEVRVQAGPDGAIQQVVLVHGDSALQLGVFAAPRSEGIWDEVRAELRTSLRQDGAAVDEIGGPYGSELRARVRTPEGVTDLRFVGVDGPRWMVRAIYQGPAAVRAEAATVLAGCLAGVVVNRGTQAMPVREPLPLQLPREAQAPGLEPAVVSAPASPDAGAAAGAAEPPPAAPRRKSAQRPRRR
jgi:hypothetical protein